MREVWRHHLGVSPYHHADPVAVARTDRLVQPVAEADVAVVRRNPGPVPYLRTGVVWGRQHAAVQRHTRALADGRRFGPGAVPGRRQEEHEIHSPGDRAAHPRPTKTAIRLITVIRRARPSEPSGPIERPTSRSRGGTNTTPGHPTRGRVYVEPDRNLKA